MKYHRNKKPKSLKLRDAAIALEYGSLPNDRRIQLKVPGFVLDEFDKVFSQETRSKAITRLMLQAIQKIETRTISKKAKSEFDELLTIVKKYAPKDGPTDLSTNYKEYLYGKKSIKFGKYFK